MNDAPEPAKGHTVDDLRPIAKYFGVDQDYSGPELTTIARNLRGDSKEMDEIDLANALRNMMWKLGDPPIGSTPLEHAFQFAKLDNQIKTLEFEKQKYVK